MLSMSLKRLWASIYWKIVRLLNQQVRVAGLTTLAERTENFAKVTWLGKPMMQNICDAWTIQETIFEQDIELVVECGTLNGGSAFFMASLFDFVGRGRIMSIDIDAKVNFSHPRITFCKGSSTDPLILDKVSKFIATRTDGKLLVLLDSNHAADYVLSELQIYSELMRSGDFLLVQDGAADELPGAWKFRPGPLVAIEKFLENNNSFSVDSERSQRYIFSNSPKGWLYKL